MSRTFDNNLFGGGRKGHSSSFEEEDTEEDDGMFVPADLEEVMKIRASNTAAGGSGSLGGNVEVEKSGNGGGSQSEIEEEEEDTPEKLELKDKNRVRSKGEDNNEEEDNEGGDDDSEGELVINETEERKEDGGDSSDVTIIEDDNTVMMMATPTTAPTSPVTATSQSPISKKSLQEMMIIKKDSNNKRAPPPSIPMVMQLKRKKEGKLSIEIFSPPSISMDSSQQSGESSYSSGGKKRKMSSVSSGSLSVASKSSPASGVAPGGSGGGSQSGTAAASAAAEEDKRIEELLCAACGFLSVPPISSCSVGHLICSICMEKVERNGNCPAAGGCSSSESATPPGTSGTSKTKNKRGRPTATTSPKLILNAFADGLVRRHVTIPVACRNRDKLGCRVKLPIFEMRDHLKSCRNRIVKCFVTQPTSCGGRLLPEDKFLDHLMVFHESRDLRFGKTKISDRIVEHACVVTEEEMLGKEKVMMNLDFFKYKKDIFFVNCVKQDNCMNWWLTMLGSEEDAVKYRYTLTVETEPDAGNVTRNSLDRQIIISDLCVHSLDTFNLAAIRKTGDFLGVHVASLESFKLDSPEEVKGIHHDYKIHVRIEFMDD